MKKLFTLLLTLALLISTSVFLFSCNEEAAEAPEGTVTRVTLDVNPEFELMVDDNNLVVAVTAMNDDAAIVIAGETIVGKTPDEAINLLLEISTDAGYIVSGNVSAGTNEINISVSGDSDYAKQLSEKLIEKTESFMSSENITASVKAAAALTEEELKALASSVSTLAEEELAKLSQNELYKLIEESRVETATLITEELREAYNSAKEYEISFTEREEYAKIMEELGGFYSILLSSYNSALDTYYGVIEDIEAFRYDNLISPDSEYQKALAAMRDKKAEFLKERQYVATLDVNGTEYASASVTLKASEEQFNAAYALVESLGKTVNDYIDTLLVSLKSAETMLLAIEEQFPASLTEVINAKASEIEASLNAAKDSFFTEFEAEHAADITATLNELKAEKEALIAANANNA
jgi:hypothetical protein